MKWMPAIWQTASVPATVVAPSTPEMTPAARSRGPILRTVPPTASRSIWSGARPTCTLPARTAMVAGIAPASRTRRSDSRATAGPVSAGSPWATSDDLERDHRGRADERVLDLGGDREQGRRLSGHRPMLHSPGCRPARPTPVRIPRQPPRVETALSCASCGTPICPDCMVQTPVGIKCRNCARQPRSARVTLRPDRAGKAIGRGGRQRHRGRCRAGLRRLPRLRVLLADRGLRGRPTGGAGDPAGSGYYRAGTTGWIAVGGAGWAYVIAAIVIAYQVGGGPGTYVQGLGLLVAGFFAYREAA